MKHENDKPPNFYGKDGKFYLVRCFVCGRENYAMNVSSGICTWCGWSVKQEKSKGD